MFNQTFIKRSLLVGLTATAAAFPVAAQAQYAESPGGSLSASQVPVTSPQLAAPAAVSATTPSGSSFHWDDAGIGAGAAVVLLGVGALGTGATRRRRQPVIG